MSDGRLITAFVALFVLLMLAAIFQRRAFVRAVARVVCLFSIRAGLNIASRAPGAESDQARPRAKRLISTEDEPWIKKAHEARLSQLETTRTTAKDWAEGLGAITGVFGIAALIQGPKEIAKLADGWKVAVAVTILIGVLCALRGIFLAAMAAQGTPKSFRYDAASFRRHYFRELNLATAALTISRVLVVVAVLAVTAAVGMTWFGDEKAVRKADVYVVKLEGAPLCGTLTVQEDGSLKVTDAQGASVIIQTTELGAIVPAGACPKPG